jgi:hypothetical protein
VAKGTGRGVFNLTTVNVGCQDEAVVAQVADVAYGSKGELLTASRCFLLFPNSGHSAVHLPIS